MMVRDLLAVNGSTIERQRARQLTTREDPVSVTDLVEVRGPAEHPAAFTVIRNSGRPRESLDQAGGGIMTPTAPLERRDSEGAPAQQTPLVCVHAVLKISNQG